MRDRYYTFYVLDFKKFLTILFFIFICSVTKCKLTQLKKQCVELFIDNISRKERIDKLKETVENQRTELLSVLTTVSKIKN